MAWLFVKYKGIRKAVIERILVVNKSFIKAKNTCIKTIASELSPYMELMLT